MDSNTTTSLLAQASTFVALLLAGTLGRRVRGIPRHIWLSFGSDVPMVFAFLHVLPTLVRDQATVTRTPDGPARLFDSHVSTAAFLGLALVYAVKRSQEAGRPSAAVFWPSVGSDAAINALIWYLLVAIHRDGRELVLFAAAMPCYACSPGTRTHTCATRTTDV